MVDKDAIEIKIEPVKKTEKKCDECPFFIKSVILDKEIQKAVDLQKKYIEEIKKVNETLTKYNKKIEELDNSDK